jgi:hypothetical protein
MFGGYQERYSVQPLKLMQMHSANQSRVKEYPGMKNINLKLFKMRQQMREED